MLLLLLLCRLPSAEGGYAVTGLYEGNTAVTAPTRRLLQPSQPQMSSTGQCTVDGSCVSNGIETPIAHTDFTQTLRYYGPNEACTISNTPLTAEGHRMKITVVWFHTERWVDRMTIDGLECACLTLV